MIRAIDHITLVVSDLERSLRFYTEILGFQEFRRAHLEGEWIEAIIGLKNVRADVAYIRAPDGEPRLELLCYESPQGQAIPANSIANTVGLRHVALRVENIHVAVKRLKEAEIKVLSEPIAASQGGITHEAGHKMLCYFFDPDGVLLELAEYR